MNYSQSTLEPQGFRVATLQAMPNPQTCVWYAKQDYMEGAIADIEPPSEKEAGEWVINTLLKKKHFGPLEHPQIIFNCIGFPHSVMQQVRTHRTGCSFDVRSGRYTGKRFVKAVEQIEAAKSDPALHTWTAIKEIMESLFYIRPEGEYTDRSGKRYFHSSLQRESIIAKAQKSVENYAYFIEQGYSEEHARSVLPWDVVRQDFVLSCNMRSLLHFFAMRSSKEAQLECQQLCDLMMDEALKWAPDIMGWWKDKHYRKAFIAP